MSRIFLVLMLAPLLLSACSREEREPATAQNVPQEPETTETAAPQAVGPSTGPIATSDPAATLAMGERYYRRGCASCHDDGAGGAPRLGDHAAWKQRIAKGLTTLVQNAIEGFTGADGVMPPRGGNPQMRAEAIALATRHLVEQNAETR